MTSEHFNCCLQMIRDGISGGIEQIYKHYHDKIVFSAQKEFNDKTIAEDIASIVFYSILKNAKNYDYIEYPTAWIYKAAKFAIINYKAKNYKTVFADIDEVAVPDKDRKLDFKIEFTRAMSKLTDKQKEIVELHYIYGLKYREIAGILKISVSTIKREINALKEKLKYLLNF